MKGKHGVSMQSIEYAPKKKGNVYCKNCKHLIFKTTGNQNSKDVKCNHWCEIKQKPRWFTSKCYCKQFEHKESLEENKHKKDMRMALQNRAEKIRTEKAIKKSKRKKGENYVGRYE